MMVGKAGLRKHCQAPNPATKDAEAAIQSINTIDVVKQPTAGEPTSDLTFLADFPGYRYLISPRQAGHRQLSSYGTQSCFISAKTASQHPH